MKTDKKQTGYKRWALCCLAALLLVTGGACSRESKPTGVRIVPAGKAFSGFLSDYARLKPNPDVENTVSYVSQDPVKNVHKYVAILIEPVVVYVATDADAKAIPDRGRAALANYFQQAIVNAVSDAFPVVQESGPLVLRLRSAIIGVDVGAEIPPGLRAGRGEELTRAVNIGKVGVEVELVDSETGEQIAAAVDRQNLGEGAVIGSVNFSREEKFRTATQAFDGWAARLREFLDSAHELSKEDITRIEASQQPYGAEQ